MENKGFADNQTNIETPSDVGITEKPLKTHLKASNRVDINVLKSKLLDIFTPIILLHSSYESTTAEILCEDRGYSCQQR